MVFALALSLSLAVTTAGVLASAMLIHWFQLESYQFPGYFRTLRRNWLKALLPGCLTGFVLGIITLMLIKLPGLLSTAFLVLAAGILIGLAVRFFFRQKKAKKPLVYTARVKRLIAMLCIVIFACTLGLTGIIGAFAGFLLIFLPLFVAAAGLLAWPIEKIITELYFQEAKRRLKEHHGLIKIGITGSYGKTSVKFILGTLLEEKYQTLVTPSSFNTPMGVTRVIRTRLEPTHQVFIAEMGARHVGDIKELCRLVNPQYGVLVSVGPQHLDTFKTIDRIAATKYELMEAIPEQGACFFSDDAGICADLYTKTQKEKYISSINRSSESDVWAENITISAQGTAFMLCTENGSVECVTKLLGVHNISNILLAASVCIKLGLTLKQISRGLARLQPVEHRLQMIANPSGYTVIDDAFNSNPSGSSAALDVLAAFNGVRRIIITPGMVELGSQEEAFNKAFGEKMATAVDTAILVGKHHTAPIVEGLLAKGFAEKEIHVVSSLDEASQLLKSIVHAGDVVMYENDLPDNYSEERG